MVRLSATRVRLRTVVRPYMQQGFLYVRCHFFPKPFLSIFCCPPINSPPPTYVLYGQWSTSKRSLMRSACQYAELTDGIEHRQHPSRGFRLTVQKNRVHPWNEHRNLTLWLNLSLRSQCMSAPYAHGGDSASMAREIAAMHHIGHVIRLVQRSSEVFIQYQAKSGLT